MRALRKWFLAGALGAGLAVGASVSNQAHACGGLFCSSANPVNQAAERIIFSFDKTAKKVTAVVEILYAGPSEKFAWVLPVPGVPKVGVSTSALLDRLQALTNPLYQVQRDFGSCNNRGSTGANATPGSPPPSPQGPSDSATVNVLATGSVGPYDYTVIMVRPDLSDRAMVAIEWLTTNGYDVGMLGADVLRPYLNDNLNLIAFKLSKNQMTGSIRPVMLTYDSEHPMIPIRPTAVAANNDMGVLAFVLSATRAVPTNYKTLELNEAAIDWFNPNGTYNDVVTQAANEAGGQGFVTEMAGTTGNGNFANNLFQEQGSVQQFRLTADNLGAGELIISMVERFSTFAQGNFGGPFGSRPGGGRVALDGVSDVIAKHVILPAGVTVKDVLASPRCYLLPRDPRNFYCDGKQAPAQPVDLSKFDKIAFLKSVEEWVIQPIEATVKLFSDQAYLTRLYTTMSAEDMTLDPEFDLNNEIGDVSNNHSVTLKYTQTCDFNGDWEATVGGFLVRGKGSTWPVDHKTMKMPYNTRVTQLSVTGLGEVKVDNRAKIAAQLGGGKAQGDLGDDTGGSCSVALGHRTPTSPAWLLLAAPLAALLLRRRH